MLRDHRGYFFTSVLSAAEFCRAADARMLRMDGRAMARRMREAHDAAQARVARGVERGVAEEDGLAALGEGPWGRRSRSDCRTGSCACQKFKKKTRGKLHWR